MARGKPRRRGSRDDHEGIGRGLWARRISWSSNLEIYEIEAPGASIVVNHHQSSSIIGFLSLLSSPGPTLNYMSRVAM